MPTYKVIADGFYGGCLYSPKHPRRNRLVTDNPIKDLPSWLEFERELTQAQKRKRQTQLANAKKKAAKDLEEIESARFETTTMKDSGVETL